MDEYDYEDEERQAQPPIEPEVVTMEAFFSAMQALQHLQDLAADGSSGAWFRRAVRMALCTVTPERMICALDKASENPDWWKVNRLHIFCPEMTQAEIGAFLDLRKPTVKHYINHVEIPADAYEALPPIPKY